MSFLDLARRRQSDRGFTQRAVERETIERCLEAARMAPSACNSQPWFFVVIDEGELREQVALCARDLVMNHFVTSAPVIVALVSEAPTLIPRLAGHWKDKPYYLMDVGIAAEHFCLAAADEGLGSCLIGWFDEKRVKKLLGVPRRRRVVLLIAVGYPADERIRGKSRKAIDEVRSYNTYRA